jgi:hypothetical protein
MYLLFKFWGFLAKAHTQANNIIVFFFSPSTRTTLYSPRLRDFLYKSMSSIGYSYARMRNSPPTKLGKFRFGAKGERNRGMRG